jgi:hypothetical protein
MDVDVDRESSWSQVSTDPHLFGTFSLCPFPKVDMANLTSRNSE